MEIVVDGAPVLGVDVSPSEAEVHWRDFLKKLLGRGCMGWYQLLQMITAALKSVLPGVKYQRC